MTEIRAYPKSDLVQMTVQFQDPAYGSGDVIDVSTLLRSSGAWFEYDFCPAAVTVIKMLVGLRAFGKF